MAEESKKTVAYTDDNIRHLSDMEHVRTRPGMYIGRLGDGKHMSQSSPRLRVVQKDIRQKLYKERSAHVLTGPI